MGIALVGFGANLGEPEQKYLEVISRLQAYPGIGVMGASRLFETTPIGGPPGQPRFHNGAILLEADRPPLEIFAVIEEIESSLGRKRGDHWGPRKIDLDLLLYTRVLGGHGGEVCLSNERLTIPHPRMHFRRFALAPANELGGDLLFHPRFGFTVAELLSHLDRQPRVIAIGGANALEASEFAMEIARRAQTTFVDGSKLGTEASLVEYVTTYERASNDVTPAQLVIWLTESLHPQMPLQIQGELRATAFSTWLPLDITDWEVAADNGAAAVAAMRPFAAE